MFLSKHQSQLYRSNIYCKDALYLQVEQVELFKTASAPGSVFAAGMRHRVVVAVVPGSADPGGVIVHTAALQLHIKEGFSDNKEKKCVHKCGIPDFLQKKINCLLFIWLFTFQDSINYMHKIQGDERERTSGPHWKHQIRAFRHIDAMHFPTKRLFPKIPDTKDREHKIEELCFWKCRKEKWIQMQRGQEEDTKNSKPESAGSRQRCSLRSLRHTSWKPRSLNDPGRQISEEVKNVT